MDAVDPNLKHVLDTIFKDDVLIPLVLGTVGVVWAVFGTLGGIVKNVARERTRREVAAYIAEGSMTPDQGERLIKAGND